MIIIISVITLLVIFSLFAKRIFTKGLQAAYERSLLNGDKKSSDQLGRIYYLSLHEKIRKAKGIIDIDAKIADDFRAFNSQRFYIF